MAARTPTKARQRPVARPQAPRPPLGRGKPPARGRWAVAPARLERLKVEWAALPAEWREQARREALAGGRYLLEMLEMKGDRK
jgi:hypothetical protein